MASIDTKLYTKGEWAQIFKITAPCTYLRKKAKCVLTEKYNEYNKNS